MSNITLKVIKKNIISKLSKKEISLKFPKFINIYGNVFASDGKSAYEVAVDNGFVGTESQWLLTIEGDAGLSAYEVAVLNGFVGTESEWLQFLKGTPGEEVEIRNDGTYIQWKYISDTSWNNIVSLSALKGNDGASIELQVNSTHIQWRVVGSSTWIDLISLSAIQGIQGIQGEKGDKGDKGDTGNQGPIGLTGLQGPQGDTGINTRGSISGTLSNQTDLQKELESKLNITSLSSNITLYATTTPSDLEQYKLVTSLSDPDYDEPAVNVPIGPITGLGQLVLNFISEPGLFVGNPGIINITSIGEIRKTSGGSSNADFYFKVFHRDIGGIETEIAVSNLTGAITNTVYTQYDISAILNNGDFVATDRIVIKYYADKIGGGSNPTYDFLHGGATPLRTLLPIPATLILTNYYTKIETDILLDYKRDLYTREYLVMNWSTTPTVNTTIAGGTVYNYILGATTRYRFVPTTYNSNQDAFYGAFDGVNLTSLITNRG